MHPSFTGDASIKAYFLPARLGKVVLYDVARDTKLSNTVYSHIVFREWTPGIIVLLLQLDEID